ncbi:hypothetical protein DSO57_1024054 [Entomophthora muscae]|uniref:Uncharacterized protein n=1 Tax=Entomophthora muscae TaxID=34485 RepID=A0ACC2S4J3_9FUNG|nr:hypothetical protein DSO57_1024054 [Entomophthora muscae]
MESVTTETPSSDLVNPSPLRQIPESNTEAPFTQDCSLWLLTGAIVATKVQTLPANVSYNTQGALNELPLDVSNVMNESGGNVKWQELHPN